MPGLASLVLADARFPGGGHVHSGGLEEAVARGLVTGLDDLAPFLRGRLRTTGLVAASFAAAAAVLAACPGATRGANVRCGDTFGSRVRPGPTEPGRTHGADVRPDDTFGPRVRPEPTAQGSPRPGATRGANVRRDDTFSAGVHDGWAELDGELDARTPSPAQRDASRAQGRGTLRAVRAAWPSPVLDDLVAVHPRPHHALLAGAVIGLAGDGPAEAARCVGYLAVSGPASAAVRLLGLDPFAVNAALVHLEPDLDDVVAIAEAAAYGPVADLPAPSAPVLDLMAQTHARSHGEHVRLFVS